ncbi:MAG: beta-galactosidase, partial [Tepidisphaeraceae bacterium]
MQEISFNLHIAPRPVLRGHLNLGGADPGGRRIDVNSYYTELDGRPWVPCMGEFHYARYPHQFWERELRKIKAGGVQVLATYAFWIHHEEVEGVFDFSGDRNLRRFIELCGQCGLFVIVRIGPFCHGEARNGGLPDWLYGYPLEARTNDPRYLAYVRRLYEQIGAQLSGLCFKDGGPIVGVQCENEFMDSAAPWETTQRQAVDYTPKGAGGNEHMLALKRLAREAGIDAPLFVSTGWGKSPILETEFLPMFGGYAFYAWLDDPNLQEPTHNYRFTDAHNRKSDKFDPSRVPFACCELGGGMQVFYRNRPVVPAESVEAMHVVYLGNGANLMGYYVYHGGSNPVGAHAFLNEHRCPRISYDFQAPLREFGQASESYHRLRRQFLFLHEWGETLAPMRTVLPPDAAQLANTDTGPVRCAVRVDEVGRGFLFVSNYQDHVEMPDRPDVRFHLDLPGRRLTVPARGGVAIRKDACAIFPINLELAGATLRYATVQPLARLEYDSIDHYFFFAIDGTAAEYAFDAASVSDVQSEESEESEASEEIQKDGDLIVVRVEPSLDRSLLLRSAGGRAIRITTLGDDASRRFWKADVGGQARAVVSNADLLFDGDEIELASTAQQDLQLWICPPPIADFNSVDPPLEGSAPAEPGRAGARPSKQPLEIRSQSSPRGPDGVLRAKAAGPFQRFDLPAPRFDVRAAVEMLASDRAVVRLPAGALDGIDEL